VVRRGAGGRADSAKTGVIDCRALRRMGGSVPLKTTEAFVIDVRKLQEADRLVILFTRDEGKVRGVAASAARSRRRFGGKLERLSRVNVRYFEKEGRDLVRVDACDLLEESFTLHQDLDSAALLAYVAEVVDTFVHEREADPRYFRLVGSLLSALRGGADRRLLARYFQIWTLRLHGLMPDLEACGGCGAALARSGACVDERDMSMAMCPACGARGGSRIRRLSPKALELLRRFRSEAPAGLAATPADRQALAEIEGFAVANLESFLGHPFQSYRFLKEIETL